MSLLTFISLLHESSRKIHNQKYRLWMCQMTILFNRAEISYPWIKIKLILWTYKVSNFHKILRWVTMECPREDKLLNNMKISSLCQMRIQNKTISTIMIKIKMYPFSSSKKIWGLKKTISWDSINTTKTWTEIWRTTNSTARERKSQRSNL